MQALREWLDSEIKKRNISISEFARQSGIAKTTILGILNDQGREYPQIHTLVELSKYTGVSVNQLFSVGQDSIRAEAYILAQRILNLPPDKQEVIFDFLSSIALQKTDSTR